MQRDTLQTSFFFLLLFGMVVLAFFIFSPYLSALVLAAVFAVIFQPLYRTILRLVNQRKNIAALLTTLCILVIIILPLLFFGFQLFQEARQVYVQLSDPDIISSNQLIEFAQERVQVITPYSRVDFNYYVQQALEWLLQRGGSIFASTAKFALNVFLSLLALFYFLRDGRALTQWLIDLSPLRDLHDQRIITRLHTAINSVIVGSLTIAVIKGVLTSIGLALFGVPNPVLWGGITVLASLIPYVGTALVLAPAIVYLLLVNQLFASVGLLIWGIVVVGLIDNLLGPQLMKRGIRLHPMVILLSVIGGLQFFGPIGYVLGPLVISFLFTLLDIYPLLVLNKRAVT